MLAVYIKAIGITAPGMNNWQEAQQVFCESEQYSPQLLAKKLPTLLAANESRRASRVTQLAISAAQQIASSEDLQNYLQIFSSSNGDLNIFHRISLALSMPGRPVSPTLFHNSVHNAPAGYWSIATDSQTASTSITAYTDSLAAGLLEAAVQLSSSDNYNQDDALLVCYDEIPPAFFLPQFPITDEFSCALILSTKADNALAKIELSLGNGSEIINHCSHPKLEQLRCANPQAMILPLLEILARNFHQSQTISLPYFEQGLNIIVSPP